MDLPTRRTIPFFLHGNGLVHVGTGMEWTRPCGQRAIMDCLRPATWPTAARLAQGKPMLACDRHLDGHRDSGTEEVKHNGPATGYANLKTLSFIGSDRQDHVNMFFFTCDALVSTPVIKAL